MKYKTSKKAMKDNYNHIISMGYCNAQFLLKYQEPMAYSTRTEGWACDYYDVDGVLISTGYSALKNKNCTCDYNLIHKYDNAALEICNSRADDAEEKVNKLLKEFIDEAIN